MKLDRSLARLYALAKRGVRRDLEGMREACAIDGEPQDRAPVVHVAGTNGKGSVCATLESIARAAGLRVGLYTSPHLVKFAERIRVDGEPIGDALLEAHLSRVLDRHPTLTFFEAATLVAFHVFAEARVELAILEVGLGGRLDATNVVRSPLATAITTIGYDHTEWLGESIEAIASEKAGIIKERVPLVTGPLPAAAMRVVEERASGALWRVGHEIVHHLHADHLAVNGPGTRSVSLQLALSGAHQRDNAAVAVGLAWILGETLPLAHAAIVRGVAEAMWPGRLETIHAGGAWLLDGAHNEEGARALGAAIDALPKRPRALVFGAMADKAWGTMLRELAPRFGHRVYVAPVAGSRAAADPATLAALDPAGEVALDVEDALARARRAVGAEGLVVVAGSLYLVGETRARLLGLERDPQVGL